MRKKNSPPSKLVHSQSLVITPGDPSGIGPEVTFKALKRHLHDKTTLPHFYIVGDLGGYAKKFAQLPLNYDYIKIVCKGRASRLSPAFKKNCGLVSGRALEIAHSLIWQKKAKALVTGPISKERLRLAGFPYDGHTEFLKTLNKVSGVTMMLSNSKLSVSLVTTHVPLANVSALITAERVRDALIRSAQFLVSYKKISRPYLKVCGLNPHAGEAGLLGKEEQHISKGIAAAKKLFPKMRVSGPYSSDTLFESDQKAMGPKKADLILAMYHDQGLIPVKLLDFPNTINITCGLPYLRTSVDHGTAFDIAGKNVADPSSMYRAIEFAALA